MVLALGVLGVVASLLVSALLLATSGYAPREWGRFVERRASRSPTLVATPLNALAGWLDRRDRMPRVASTALPAWAGIGAGATATAPTQGIVHTVNSVESLRVALAQVNPGDTILLQDGRYIVSERPIELNRAGTAQAPIRLVGGSLGAASI
ncbi:MAG: hypothetical protein ABIU95_13980, partial [Burkholderiales bacterium]